MKTSPHSLWLVTILALLITQGPMQAVADPTAQMPYDATDNGQAPSAQTAPAAPAALEVPEFPYKAIDALDMIDQGRYTDAADAASVLCAAAPGSSIARQIRGTVELWLGDTKLAQRDFAAAAVDAPDEAVTHYGLALCALRGAEAPDAALPELQLALACPGLSPQQQQDAAALQAYISFVEGDAAPARALAGHANPSTQEHQDSTQPLPEAGTGALDAANLQSDEHQGDPTLDELIAVATAHSDAHDGVLLLEKFLTTANGIPRVEEDDGLRLTFMSRPALEATISDPSILAMYADRLAQPAPAPDADSAEQVDGTITLSPSTTTSTTSSVRFTIDGAFAGIAASPPYVYAWNTREMLDGVHTVKIEECMGSGGVVGVETHAFLVVNGPDAQIGVNQASIDPDTYQQIETRLWTMLSPRPSRAVAELIIARFAARRGDRAGAESHFLIASALDPSLAAAHPVPGLPHPEPSRFTGAAVDVWKGPSTSKRVALTFDDGPNAHTSALLDAIAAAHANVTFFVIGTRIEVRPEEVRRMHAMGAEVENHSYTHPNISQCLPAMVESEILRTNIIIRSLTGRYPLFFRPPGGNASPTLARLSSAYGLRLAFWTIDALKAEETGSPSGLVDFVMKRMRPGAIVLMHNGPLVTVQAVPKLVAALRAHGYQIVTLHQLMGN